MPKVHIACITPADFIIMFKEHKTDATRLAQMELWPTTI
jgi:hypothetical protein